MKKDSHRYNIKLRPDINDKLRFIALRTDLKITAIIGHGIEAEYDKLMANIKDAQYVKLSAGVKEKVK